MKENSIKFNQAYELVKSKRQMISPNNGFVMQLRFYEAIIGISTEEEVKKDIKTNKYIRDITYLN